jgi:sulfhydrogenase subunit beta (sulfur reductase)
VATIGRDGLAGVITELRRRGHEVIAPTLAEGVIALSPIDGIDDLPEGWTDDQEGGQYRVRRRADAKLFGYAVGPVSPKRYLFPPRERLAAAERADDSSWTPVSIRGAAETVDRPLAFVGIRPCELAGMRVQDRVFLAPGREDPGYEHRRSTAFVVVVNCGDPAATCFCSSMGTGPRASGADPGFDLALTEILTGESGESVEYVVDVGTQRGADLIDAIVHRSATPTEVAAAHAVTAHAVETMGRSMDTSDIHDVLVADPDHPRWDDVAERCLTCANCTLVCPTCFCHTMEDTIDLVGEHADRWRVWDSCFTFEFSEMGGHPTRASGKARYRQWLTHKLATWQDQFGSSGCVGCGRCITWCPVGIDLTEEVRALRAPSVLEAIEP